MNNKIKKGIAFAILAAALYALNSPLSKILLQYMPPTLMAGFLYIGAGIGMAVIALFRKVKKSKLTEQRLTRTELPYTVAMIVLDIAAPIFLMIGLNATTAANASLLNNFEIVATAIIALAVFKEKISPRLWCGIFFVTLSCTVLSFENLSGLQFSKGSLFVLLATVCWGFENNCTRKISSKDPLQIVLLKGDFFRLRLNHHRSLPWRTHNRAVEYFCGLHRRLCSIRLEYLFLCICSTLGWCSKNKCLLCRCTIHCSDSFAFDFPRNAKHLLLCCTCSYGSRCMAFIRRQTPV